MVLPLLLPLLASLQSLLRPVTPAGHPGLPFSTEPPASVPNPLLDPTLSVRGSSSVYPPGELVTLVCSPPLGERAGAYKFFFRKGQQGPSTLLKESLEPQLKFRAERGWAGSYTCAYWRWGSKGTNSFRSSSPISITVTAPQLTMSPPQPVYIAGEAVTLTCSAAGAPALSGIRFFRDGQKIHSKELPSPQDSYNHSLQLSGLSGSQAGVYSCEFWKTLSGRELLSETSSPVNITVTNPPPQPVLSVDPPSGAVREGLPLLLTCTAPGDTGERRFHFYKDGVEFVPREEGSVISTMEPGSRSVKGSVLNISRASSNDSGEFTCGYEDNMSGRWILSLKSQAVNVTVNVPRTASCKAQNILLITSGVLLPAGALAALICYCCRKKRVPKPLKSTEGSVPREHARNTKPTRHNKGPKAPGAGVEQVEQGSEVTYAHIEFSSLDARTGQWKNRAQPAAEAHVLYSEVGTKPTRKAAR